MTNSKDTKRVLILCTGNSCRSIIAEALINDRLDGVEVDSSGVKASGRVNPNAKPFEAFEQTFEQIEGVLLPKVSSILESV